nr:GTP binding protein Di Ras2 [Hymenolepis microstoma]
MPEQPNDYRVAVFGASGVGKSSLVLRFVKGTFREAYIPTIEDTFRQVISCNKQVCTLQITDTTGSHQFPAMQRLSISRGHAFMLIYSITNRVSIDELVPIYEELVRIKGQVAMQSIPVMLVGNKSDEEESCREVPTNQGEELARKWNCGFMETSAKNNLNVKEVFQELLRMETRQNMTLVGDSSDSKSFLKCFRFLRHGSTQRSPKSEKGNVKPVPATTTS